jgi:hypothetical protein
MCFNRMAERPVNAVSFPRNPMRASRHASPWASEPLFTITVALAASLVAAGRNRRRRRPEGPPAAWRVECTGDGKTLICRAIQQVYHRESRQLLVQTVVRPAADGKSGEMILQLPLGLNLTEPVLIKVDSGQPERKRSKPAPMSGASSPCRWPTSSWPRCAAAAAEHHGAGFHQEAGRHEPALLGFGLAFDKSK